MARDPQLPVVYRYFGNQFLLWRNFAQVRREDIAEAGGYSVDTVKSIEQGRRPVPRRLAEIADEMCGAEGKLLAGLGYLKKERKFPERSRDYFAHESNAVALNSYETTLIPGLLQTEAYARALIGNSSPPQDDETVEAQVRARVDRASLLTQTPPVACSFVLYEAALRARVGGDEVHKAQLQHLLHVAGLRHVSLQVLPFARTVPPALVGPMVLLEMQDHERYTLVEGQALSQFSSEPDEVSMLAQRYGMIRMQALNAEESVRFIERLVDEL
ncbi:helix-turn-helix domain-containing protein [Streptomyces specialis]|uniref:helix-turn-helix domain-containing protein n=1 Tax=Streptomyces specialis TaxID=498367 RepID=UPI00073F31DC|nr:helix-turn-helix transcriptional regulator [Streptomyces specialis]